jgi:hypothetical protein
MPRPSGDGRALAATRRRHLTRTFLERVRPEGKPFRVWERRSRAWRCGFQPSGRKTFEFYYRSHGHPAWFVIGDGTPEAARARAAELRNDVLHGKDPVAERKAERGAGAFAELAERYLEQHAKRHNKSWEQADALVRRYLVPRWGKLAARTISRVDVKRMFNGIAAPVLANQVLAAASAIFSWAEAEEELAANPCRKVKRHQRPRVRARRLGNRGAGATTSAKRTSVPHHGELVYRYQRTAIPIASVDREA